MTVLSPRSHALAYRILAVATPLDWNITSTDLAAALGESGVRTRRVVAMKGWTNRLRGTALERSPVLLDDGQLHRGDMDVRFHAEAAE